jgi:carbonic anhydrase
MHTLAIFLLILFVETVQSWDWWDYKDSEHVWPKLAGSSCGGSSQSPICINQSEISAGDYNGPGGSVISIHYGPAPGLIIENNGKTLAVNGEMGWITINRKIYTAKHFHFHQPAEHLVNGRRNDMEMHVVHRNEITSDLVIFAFLFKVEFGAPGNKFLRSIGYDSPSLATKGGSALISEINLMDLFTDVEVSGLGAWDVMVNFFKGPGLGKVAAWTYKGSLTTPPCTEGQRFFVFEQPRVMSRKQWEGFANSVGHGIDWEKKTGNRRETQPLNGRKVYSKVISLKNKGQREQRPFLGLSHLLVQ